MWQIQKANGLASELLDMKNIPKKWDFGPASFFEISTNLRVAIGIQEIRNIRQTILTMELLSFLPTNPGPAASNIIHKSQSICHHFYYNMYNMGIVTVKTMQYRTQYHIYMLYRHKANRKVTKKLIFLLYHHHQECTGSTSDVLRQNVFLIVCRYFMWQIQKAKGLTSELLDMKNIPTKWDFGPASFFEISTNLRVAIGIQEIRNIRQSNAILTKELLSFLPTNPGPAASNKIHKCHIMLSFDSLSKQFARWVTPAILV